MEIFDVAIIGSGPAGLTAGIYTSRANLKTLILAGAKWGGQLMLTTEIENYPGFPEGIQGPQLMEKIKKQAEKFGAHIKFQDATKVQKENDLYLVSCNLETYRARAVIIATGADTQWLGLPNELRLIGHGVSSCAPCDAFFFKDKKVAVVGGGDAAMEEALVLTKFASEVTIIHRRDSFRASKIMQDRALSNPKIKVLYNTEVVDVLGQDKVEGLVLKKTSNQQPATSQLAVNGMFVAIGHKPNSQIFDGLVELDQKGYISKSLMDGVFIAGDVQDYKYRQAVTAAAYGTMAALEVEKWLENQK
ncbi:thioredoxin-disulfide reductase [Patescibacteria group bacterium]|nr:thioredoxin-disulfide reductase [Patescibacteria group bacterium]